MKVTSYLDHNGNGFDEGCRRPDLSAPFEALVRAVSDELFGHNSDAGKAAARKIRSAVRAARG